MQALRVAVGGLALLLLACGESSSNVSASGSAGHSAGGVSSAGGASGSAGALVTPAGGVDGGGGSSPSDAGKSGDGSSTAGHAGVSGSGGVSGGSGVGGNGGVSGGGSGGVSGGGAGGKSGAAGNGGVSGGGVGGGEHGPACAVPAKIGGSCRFADYCHDRWGGPFDDPEAVKNACSQVDTFDTAPCPRTGVFGYCTGTVNGNTAHYASFQYSADAAASVAPICVQYGGTWCAP